MTLYPLNILGAESINGKYFFHLELQSLVPDRQNDTSELRGDLFN